MTTPIPPQEELDQLSKEYPDSKGVEHKLPTTQQYKEVEAPVSKVTKLENCKPPTTNRDKWIMALVAGLLFAALSSPFLYSFTGDLTRKSGMETVTEGGVPNVIGLVLHAVVFIVLVRLLLDKY